MSVIALWIGLAMVWVLGFALLAAIHQRSRPSTDPGEIAWMVGCGWFVGQFLLTLWMRVLSAVGIPFGVPAIIGPLGALTVLATWVAWHRHGVTAARTLKSRFREIPAQGLAGVQRILWLSVASWLALRFALLLIEVLRRPLYPWDAWTQWATKARVWYELKTMVPFATSSEWLSATSGGVYFDAAPNYPATVPLTQVWSALLLGQWDDALINVPWWLTGTAFGFALYGFLKQRRLGPVAALLGTWLALSMPIFDTHIALAGYADLAMATYFTLAALASIRWTRTRDWADAVPALLFIVACTVIKNPGKLWILMLVPGIAAALLPRHGLRFAAALFGALAIAALILTRIGLTILGYHLRLEFDMPWSGLSEAYFEFANWHLLWYGAIAVAVLGWRQVLNRDLAPLSLTIAAGVAFLMFGFAFTNARVWVEDQSTVNRATLHLAPLIVVWMVLTFREWAVRQSISPIAEHAEHAEPAPGS